MVKPTNQEKVTQQQINQNRDLAAASTSTNSISLSFTLVAEKILLNQRQFFSFLTSLRPLRQAAAYISRGTLLPKIYMELA